MSVKRVGAALAFPNEYARRMAASVLAVDRKTDMRRYCCKNLFQPFRSLAERKDFLRIPKAVRIRFRYQQAALRRCRRYRQKRLLRLEGQIGKVNLLFAAILYRTRPMLPVPDKSRNFRLRRKIEAVYIDYGN